MKNYDYINNQFIIYNYNQRSPFANFLPGVAGKMGIPLWVFYTNRGQGISGYGLQDKNHPIMAFTPANKAYETTPVTGFRTFIKHQEKVYEAFHVDSQNNHKMIIDYSSFSIEEVMQELNLKIKITYVGLPNESLGGLVRKVELTNLNDQELDIELLDGIAEILPSGIQNSGFKSTSNLLASWADVKHIDESLAYFTLRASTGDSSEVKKMEAGNYYFGFIGDELIRPIVDPELIFGLNTAKTKANGFMESSIKELLSKPQVTTNKFGCAFMPLSKNIKANETICFYAISGHAKNFDILKEFSKKILKEDFINKKIEESNEEINKMLDDVQTDSAFPIFDNYIKQNYLDNILRGGYPLNIGDTVYHLYSRRHGDLERDYNFFSLAPEYYSQGNGNFRDVCQNRRLDTYFNKEVKDFNIRHFASLIQLDGYNPLSINGINYKIRKDVKVLDLVKGLFADNHDKIVELLSQPFTPGTIVNFIEQNKIKHKKPIGDYLDKIIENSEAFIQAVFGEGFWIDHFTYVLDLVESYESIYPDKMKALLFENENYYYYDSPVSVRKKSEKIVLNDNGDVRQYGSLIHLDDEKINRLKMNPHASNWSKIKDVDYKSNLFIKLLVLVLNKHSLLDPDNIGIEMEAEKPGWNDAMNGLPGLLGSGVSESIELLRIIDFLLDHIDNGPLKLPTEIYNFFSNLNKVRTYDERVKSRENYRDDIRFGLKGDIEILHIDVVQEYLFKLKQNIQDSITKLYEKSDYIIPTFLRYDVNNYEVIKDDSNQPTHHNGYQLVKPLNYNRNPLTPFLEAPARLLKTTFGKEKLLKMHEKIKHSDLYDQELHMYKTSACINDESHEIGRIHAFTKGWLERESNFLHMTYKYLLGLLKAGLYDAFYEEIKDNLVCFMDPEIYKRSTLENSSFIATSNNPDPSIHGKGFFARLSGSTVEAVNMWSVMMTGGKPFKYVNGTLRLEFEPKIHHTFFKEDKTLSFKFLKNIKVTYINQSLKNTFDDCEIYKIEVK
ncbi:MAG: cellobiose phosphorylase, partial [Tenericutes bacterium]|nr:cellobiose phosphorylase [Mycoplasmatota bacterium]